MFSQFRKRLEDGLEAVEHLAQSTVNSPHSATTSPTSGPSPSSHHPNGHSNSPSLDGAGSPRSSLAYSAPLFNIGRTLSLQRSASPSSPDGGRNPRQSSLDGNERELKPVRKTTALEDRLRASFVIGEASTSTTPEPVSVTPATPVDVEAPSRNEVTDPAFIPLPMSPPLQTVAIPTPPYILSPQPRAFEDPLSPNLYAEPLAASPIIISKPPSPSPINSSPYESPPPPSEPPVRPSPPLTEEPYEETHPPSTSLTKEVVDDSTDRKQEPESVEVQADSQAVASIEFTEPPPPPVISGDTDQPRDIARAITPALSPSPLDSGAQSTPEQYEAVVARLKLVEQRFADMSTSFKRMRSEKTTVDQILRKHTAVESISDPEALSAHFENMTMKAELSTEEIKRLNGQLAQYDERIQELRDTHRLEGQSRSEQVDKLKKQTTEAEALLTAAYADVATLRTEAEKQNEAIAALKTELAASQKTAKDEEEKRVKAISLLKTVRQKSVKAEKEREEAVKERDAAKADAASERDKQRNDRIRFETDTARDRAEREKEIAGLRSQFEVEVNSVRERFERENNARKSQFELEAITVKATHNKETNARINRISQLEASLRSVSLEKDDLFDQVQQRQAELESTQSMMESLTNQVNELQHQLRERDDRIGMLTEELADARRKSDISGSSTPGQSEATFLIAEVESKYENRIADMRERMRTLDKERTEAEEEWSRNMQERSKDVDKLRSLLAEKEREHREEITNRAEREEKVRLLEERLRSALEDTAAAARDVQNAKAAVERAKQAEISAREAQAEASSDAKNSGAQLEELRNREMQLRTSNKTLRDELRKVQSSAALLERQRNPGVGYWAHPNASRPNGFSQQPDTGSSSPVGDVRSLSSRPSSPTQSVMSDGGGSSRNAEEEVNLEYLRNVILQFLEHKEMRPNLVRVMAVILRFTPQETRRLVAKV